MSYDEVYSKHPDYFGLEPDQILVDHWRQLDKDKPVLDVGAGPGRNSIFLAKQGLTVDAIDPSRVAIETLITVASALELSINTSQSGFEELNIDPGHYSGILLFGIIQILNRESIGLLLDRTNTWCNTGGLVFVNAFSTNDASFERFSGQKKIAKNSFVNYRGTVRTFLEPNEILTLFDRFEIVHHWEGLEPIHRHGNNPPEQHAMIEAVFRKV